MHIHDDLKPRNKWTLATVEKLITGNDGHVRAAEVRTKNGQTSRPIVKLFPIEIKMDTERKNETVPGNSAADDIQMRKPSTRESSRRAMENIHKWINNGL